MKVTQNYLDQLELSQLMELAKFVVDENLNHHYKGVISEGDLKADIQNIYSNELNYYNNSKIFIAKDSCGNIQGSIRIVKWDYKAELPIQKIFNINPWDLISAYDTSSVWHIGRFAINKANSDPTLFKKLMMYAITPICSDEKSHAFAECDSRLLRVLNIMGIKVDVIGDSIDYLGSETIPIYINYSGLEGFYNANQYLVS